MSLRQKPSLLGKTDTADAQPGVRCPEHQDQVDHRAGSIIQFLAEAEAALTAAQATKLDLDRNPLGVFEALGEFHPVVIELSDSTSP